MSKGFQRTVDLFKNDLEKMKHMTGAKRRQFLWDYYKLPILAILIILLMVVVSLVFRTDKKNVLMYVVVINGQEAEDSRFFEDMLTRAGEDIGTKRVNVDTGMTLGLPGNEAADGQTMQVLAALFGIGDLDMFAANEEVFQKYQEKDAFVDLGLFIEKDVLEQAGDLIYYAESSEGVRIAAGLVVTPGTLLYDSGYFAEDRVILGVDAQAQNIDLAIAAVKEILTEELR